MFRFHYHSDKDDYHFVIFSSGVKRFDKRYMENNIYVRAIYSRRIERVYAKLIVEILRHRIYLFVAVPLKHMSNTNIVQLFLFQNPKHAESKVTRLLEGCMDVICKHIDKYDFEGFPDEFLIK